MDCLGCLGCLGSELVSGLEELRALLRAGTRSNLLVSVELELGRGSRWWNVFRASRGGGRREC